jgi:hypothetical protein
MQTFSLSYLILSLLVFSFLKFFAAKKSPGQTAGEGESVRRFSVITVYVEKTGNPSKIKNIIK